LGIGLRLKSPIMI